MVQPKTSYARNGDVNIAYQVVGDGPLDLLFIPPFVSHLDLFWAAPETAAFFSRLASFSRLILFDKRGTGLSDPVSGVATLEERMEDVHAVLDACGSQRAAIFGLSEGGPMSLLFAATYPERTTALITFGSFAKLLPAPHYFWERREGVSYAEDVREHVERTWDQTRAFTDALEHRWGEGKALALYVPSIAGDANAQRMLGMFERAAASPAMVHALWQFNAEIDVTHVLPVIGVPTLVLHRTDDLVPVEYGHYLAEHVPGARFVELAGNDHMPWIGDSDAVLDEVERFLTGGRRGAEPDRVLATVLFTDIAGSTVRAAELGDRRWSELLEAHHGRVRALISRYGGREVDTAGDGFLATFDGPTRAIKCAEEITAAVQTIGLEVRAGVHTGEIVLAGDDVRGIAVHVGARIAAMARAGEVLVSSTVRDLVAGSGLRFDDRGLHSLKGVPDEWQLLAVAGGHDAPTVAIGPGNPLAPNSTLVTRSDRTALRLARRAPGVARLMSRAMSRKAQPQETHA
jgi:pimeloyl-ACP methyl ester carboxylesterase/class 3 adenylate cyclase